MHNIVHIHNTGSVTLIMMSRVIYKYFKTRMDRDLLARFQVTVKGTVSPLQSMPLIRKLGGEGWNVRAIMRAQFPGWLQNSYTPADGNHG